MKIIRGNGELTVTINGVELNQYGKVLDVRRPLFGSIDVTTTQISGRDGALASKPRRGALYYEVEMVITGDTAEESVSKLNEIRKLVKPKKGVEMVVSDEPYKTVHAKLEGSTDYDTEVNTKSLSLSFIIEKGYGTGDALNQVVPSGTTIDYDATAESEPTLTVTFTGETQGFKATHTMPDGETRVIEVDDLFHDKDVLIIDCYKKYVTINGESAMPYLIPMSRWFTLDVGINTFEYEAFTGEFSGEVEIKYDENWY